MHERKHKLKLWTFERKQISIDPKIEMDSWAKLTTFGQSTSIIQGGNLKDNDNCLHDMVRKHSSGEISREHCVYLL
jgi:hypothetical protein